MTNAFRIFAATLLLYLAFAPFSFARTPTARKAIVAYVFAKDAVLAPNEVIASTLTRVNYAFANIENGKMVEGFAHDRENFQVLHNLKQQNPALEIVVSAEAGRGGTPEQMPQGALLDRGGVLSREPPCPETGVKAQERGCVDHRWAGSRMVVCGKMERAISGSSGTVTYSPRRNSSA